MSTNFTPSVTTLSVANGGTSEILTAINGARRSIIINPQTEACLVNFGATAGLQATGTLSTSTNPLNTETIAVNGVTFTFVTGASTATNVHIGATEDETLANFAVVLNASANASISVATYTVDATLMTITYDAGGADGNAFTLADSSGSVAITRSNPTLTGGSNTVGGITIPTAGTLTLKIGDGFGSICQDIYILSASNAAKINYLEGFN
jgi:hypothetical protein